MNYRMVIYITGRIMTLGAVMLVAPLAVSAYYNDHNIFYFLITMLLFLGLGIVGIFFKPKKKEIYAKEGMIVVALSWVIFSFLGGLPFYFSHEIPNLADCFFETVSGFTTTGSTILTDVEKMSKSMLFWRSLTHWIGGMGVLVFAHAIFEHKDTRISHIMRAEMPGPQIGKMTEKWRFSIRILYLIYIILTVAEFILLMLGGMPAFDSIVHTFGTAGTGGFGVKNSSIGFYNSTYIDYVIGIFMFLFGMNFNIYFLIIARKWTKLRENDEVKLYISIVAVASIIIALNISPIYGGFVKALRYSFFQVSSIITTTGYATGDFNTWPVISQFILVILMIVGCCAGSTGGGLKLVRVSILIKGTARAVKRTIFPRSVSMVKNDGASLENSVISGVFVYFALYMIIMAASIFIICFDNFDITTSVTAVIATFNNIGPGLSKVGPIGNFSEFSVLSKLVLSFDMLAGRLELYPMIALLMPQVWKRI